jgi:hypothetical protein
LHAERYHSPTLPILICFVNSLLRLACPTKRCLLAAQLCRFRDQDFQSRLDQNGYSEQPSGVAAGRSLSARGNQPLPRCRSLIHFREIAGIMDLRRPEAVVGRTGRQRRHRALNYQMQRVIRMSVFPRTS